jgi:aminopeptidase-like protein
MSGAEMHALLAELYPICRSLTGDGVRQTLRIIGRDIPLTITEVPTGTKVLDWVVPREWNIRDGWLRRVGGEMVASFRDSNLHVMGYSIPIHARMTLSELKPHLFSDPEHPDVIPYRTSYYQENWGFCLADRVVNGLTEAEYEVHIDSTLSNGALTYGECYLPGERTDEILIACHTCHPSLANDSLSGVVVAASVAKMLAARRHRYSYRFLFAPGTIGAIAWLAAHDEHVTRVKHALVATCLGDGGSFTYKKSRQGSAEIDRAAVHVLKQSTHPWTEQPFSPYGGDERQFCSPGFNLPCGSLMRTPYGEFPEYHTSADDLRLVRAEHLAESLGVYLGVCDVLDRNGVFVNLNPKGEPQLGRRGLYGAIGGAMDARQRELAMLWVLNLSDGGHSLLDIAERASLPFDAIRRAADTLVEHQLLRENC